MSEVISQAAPTLCIQVPMLDTTVAIQIERKSAWRSGLHAEPPGSGLFAAFSRVGTFEDWEFFMETSGVEVHKL
ncbi:MAG TPA: hypothetical protein VGC99_16120 [Candidatus Tectomicrobia bacterium]